MNSFSLQEICTLTIATEFGGDQLNVLNFIGLVICMSGIGVHVYFKALKGRLSFINSFIIHFQMLLMKYRP